MNSNCCKKWSLNILCMSDIVFDFFIRNLKKPFFNHKFWMHAKLPGYIVFPDPALYLCKKSLTRHEIRTVGWKKENNRSRCIDCVNHCLRMVDSCIIWKTNKKGRNKFMGKRASCSDVFNWEFEQERKLLFYSSKKTKCCQRFSCTHYDHWSRVDSIEWKQVGA